MLELKFNLINNFKTKEYLDMLKFTFEALEKIYYKLFADVDEIPVQVVIADDMNSAHLEIRPDLKDYFMLDAPDNGFNGRMVAPIDIDDAFIILMNYHRILQYTEDGSLTWMGTFAHELTHIHDYTEMSIKEKMSSYLPLEKIQDYIMFQMWTEYHARKKGYLFLRYIFWQEGKLPGEDEQKVYIREKEWPYHINEHYKEFHMNDDGNNQMYITMQLLGRYSAWCDLFPDSFNVRSFAKDYKANPWIIHLFSFLREHESLESIYPCFNDLKCIFRENWDGIF